MKIMMFIFASFVITFQIQFSIQVRPIVTLEENIAQTLIQCHRQIITSYLNGEQTMILGKSTETNDTMNLNVWPDIFDEFSYEKTNMSIIIHDSIGAYPRSDVKASLYVLLVDKTENLRSLIEMLSNDPNWNPRCKFIIYSAGIKQNMRNLAKLYLQVLVDYFILESLIVLKSVHVQNADIFTWYPYSSKQCGKVVKRVVLLDKCGTINNVIKKKPKILQGDFLKDCNLEVGIHIAAPYTVTVNSQKGNNVFESFQIDENALMGQEIALLYYIFNDTEMNFQFKEIELSDIGEIFPENNTATGLFEKLLRGDLEILLGGLSLTHKELLLFETTYPYMYDTIDAYVKKSDPLSSWKNIFWCLTTDIWFYSFVAYVTGSILIFISLRQDSNSHLSLGSSFFFLWTISMGMSAETNSKFFNFNYLFMMWLWFTYFIRSAYQTMLVSVLTNPDREFQVKSLHDLLVRNYTLGLTPLILDFIGAPSNDDKFQSFYENGANCEEFVACNDRATVDGKFAAVNFDSFFVHDEWRFIDSNGDSKLYKVDNPILTLPIIMIMRKGHFLVEFINQRAQIAVETGVVKEWEDLAKFYGNLYKQKKIKLSASNTTKSYKNGSKVLSMTNLKGAFYLILLGILLSILVLASEIYIARRDCGNPFR